MFLNFFLCLGKIKVSYHKLSINLHRVGVLLLEKKVLKRERGLWITWSAKNNFDHEKK